MAITQSVSSPAVFQKLTELFSRLSLVDDILQRVHRRVLSVSAVFEDFRLIGNCHSNSFQIEYKASFGQWEHRM
jgi:hypothetical protein